MIYPQYPPSPGPSELTPPRPVGAPPGSIQGHALHDYTPPPPLCGTPRSSKEDPRFAGEMRADPARADTRGGLYDAATYHAWGLAQAVASAAIRDGANPDPTAVRLTRLMAEVFAGDLAVFLRKQMDYGPGNIAAFGVPGVAIRSHDKVERIRTLLRLSDANGAALRAAVKGEAVEDTFGDQTNYGAIARLVLRGEWPPFEEPPCRAP